MEITKEFNFELAHSLGFHKGQCANLHGHSYKMMITIKSNKLVNGMIMDFSELKSIVNETIINQYDHACVINENSDYEFDKQLIALLKRYNKKLVLVNFYPTAEEMARHFFEKLKETFNKDVHIEEVVLYETKASYARYGEDL